MRTKNIIIIVVVAVIICTIGVGAYYLTQSEYKTISMTGITIEVPNSDATVNNNRQTIIPMMTMIIIYQ